MRWSEAVGTVRMQRVAVVAPRAELRAALVRLADAGCVEVDLVDPDDATRRGPAARRLQRLRSEDVPPALSVEAFDPDAWERAGEAALLAGEAQLERHADSAVGRGPVAALAGWCPVAELPRLTDRLAELGGAVVPLPSPRGAEPPTLLRRGGPVRRGLTPLTVTYGTVPYRDVDPTWPAGLVYAVMFGMMFGDAGHGALLVLLALLLRSRRTGRLAGLRRAWPLVTAAGAAACAFGLAYGEFFGPTGALPVLWLSPLDQPRRLLAAGIAVGCVLLTLAYAAGVANRWREGGPSRALYSATGVAGALVFLGLLATAGGVLLHQVALTVPGAVVGATGGALAAAGYFSAAKTAGVVTAAVQTAVQLFDTVVRIFSNTVSFARLAAFGLTHAALGAVVWHGASALARHGPGGWIGAVGVFLLGNALAFALEALVAGVQALRLEYYELFSRVFEAQGRPFRPWHVTTAAAPSRPSKETA
jgi:V/A-type H+-transporting ATPase subunit I